MNEKYQHTRTTHKKSGQMTNNSFSSSKAFGIWGAATISDVLLPNSENPKLRKPLGEGGVGGWANSF